MSEKTSQQDAPAKFGSAKRAVCLIPSGEMLRLKPVKHWLKRFSDFTRRSATEVVLPAVGFSGPLYDSKVHPFPQRIKLLIYFLIG